MTNTQTRQTSLFEKNANNENTISVSISESSEHTEEIEEEKKQLALFSQTLYDIFSLPKVVFTGMEGFYTSAIQTEITIHRMATLMKTKDYSNYTVSDFEIFFYLATTGYTRTLDDTFYNITCFLYSSLYPELAKDIGLYNDALDDYELVYLTCLKTWIFLQQINEQHKRRWKTPLFRNISK